MENLILIGVMKTDNGIIRHRVRSAGAIMFTNYHNGLQVIMAVPEKAQKALNDLFPYHQLMRIQSDETIYLFDNGTERIVIDKKMYHEIENNLIQLQCITK